MLSDILNAIGAFNGGQGAGVNPSVPRNPFMPGTMGNTTWGGQHDPNMPSIAMSLTGGMPMRPSPMPTSQSAPGIFSVPGGGNTSEGMSQDATGGVMPPGGNNPFVLSDPRIEALRQARDAAFQQAAQARTQMGNIPMPMMQSGVPTAQNALGAGLFGAILQGLGGRFGGPLAEQVAQSTQQATAQRANTNNQNAQIQYQNQRSPLEAQQANALQEAQNAGQQLSASQTAWLDQYKADTGVYGKLGAAQITGQSREAVAATNLKGALARANNGQITAMEAPMIAILKNPNATPDETAQAYMSLRSMPNSPYSEMTDDQINKIASTYKANQVAQFAKADLFKADQLYKLDQIQRADDLAPSVKQLTAARANAQDALAKKYGSQATFTDTQNAKYDDKTNAFIANQYAQAANLNNLGDSRRLAAAQSNIAKMRDNAQQTLDTYQRLLQNPALDDDTRTKYQTQLDAVQKRIDGLTKDGTNIQRSILFSGPVRSLLNKAQGYLSDPASQQPATNPNGTPILAPDGHPMTRAEAIKAEFTRQTGLAYPDPVTNPITGLTP